MRVAASWVRTGARFAGVGLCAVLSCAAAMAQVGKPEKLECESLVTPLGMDAEKPTLVVATARYARWREADGV